jgi:hypothetical protein
MLSRIERMSSKERMFLPKMSKNLHKTIAAMALLAEGLRLKALLTHKSNNSLISLVCTQTRSVHDGMGFDFALQNTSKK